MLKPHRRRSRFASSAALAVLLLAGGLTPPAAAATERPGAEPPLRWHVTSRPFGLTFSQRGRVVAAEAPGDLAGPGGRLSYQVGGSASSQFGASYHRLTDLLAQSPLAGGGVSYLVATDEPGRTATVAVGRTPEGARVQWSFTPAGGVTLVFESLRAGPTEHYLSGSSAAFVDLRGHIRGWSPGKEGNEAGSYCQNQEQTASPFYLSSGGYGLYAETGSVGRFAFPGATQVADAPNCANTPSLPAGAERPYPCPVAADAQADRVQVCVKAGSLTYHVFAGSPQAVTGHYYRTVGLPSLPPPTQFALMRWRDVSQDQAQVLADVAAFKQLGIPIGLVWVDNPYELQPPGNSRRVNGSACTNSGRFDPAFFPDPGRMIDTLHAEGVRFGLWTTAHVGTPGGSQGGGSCAGINDLWSRNGWLIPGTNYVDFSIPAARQHYVDQLASLFSLGVDMAKEDRGEEFRLETATLAGGSGAELYLRYPDLYHQAVSEALRRVNGDDFETLVRAGGPGSAQHTHGIWGSDTTQTFAGLRAEVRYGISESLTGHFAWGSDTGGIDPLAPANAGNSPTPALFTRWAQFSAVSPVLEVGGAGLNATPWLYPEATVDRFRDSAVLHYELFPYLYGLAREAARGGVPILRAVGYQYPDDQTAWAQDQELMVGPDLLVAPVSGDRAEADGAAGQATPVEVYLPAGRWVDLFSGQVLDGGRTVVRDTTLDEFPLYLRAGAAIGFNARGPDLWADGWGTDDLARPGLGGWLVAPGAGGGRAVSSGPGRLLTSTRGDRTRLELRDAPAEAQVVVLAARAPRAVVVDGRPLRAAPSTTGLRARSDGWTLTSGPFGGLVLKLRPRHGQARVEIIWSPSPAGRP